MASKKLVADVFDAVVIDNTDGSVAGSTTLQTGNIDVAVSEVEVRSGKGNALQAVLHIQRDINVSLTDVEWKMEWLEKQLGTSTTTGSDVGYAMPTWYTVNGSKQITLPATPITATPADAGIKVYDTDGKEITNVSINGAIIELSTASEGDEVEVRTYKYNTPSTTQVLNFEADKFAKGCTLVLSTFETDENESHPFELQYQFPTAIPVGNFQINTSSEKNAATQTFDLKIVKPTSTTVAGKLLRIPLS